MKKINFFLPTIFIFICGLFLWWSFNVKPVSDKQDLRSFLITKGSSASSIGQKLKDNNFIRSSFAFKMYVQLTGKQQKIQAGEYNLSSSWNLFKIVDQFVKGPEEVWVTIPEGFRKEQVMERFITLLAKDGTEADIFRNEFEELTQNKEGFLFPDTYLFSQTASASAVVSKLSQTFDKKVDKSLLSEIEKSPYSLEEVITIASLVERETKNDSERPVVAGILYKRLQEGWPLQVDASVQYAATSLKCSNNYEDCNWWPGLTKADLQLNSSFNTYKNIGLPPHPICNSGLSSIKAAIYPETSPYWFYLHDSEGRIHFAKTLEEHNQNISLYLN